MFKGQKHEKALWKYGKAIRYIEHNKEVSDSEPSDDSDDDNEATDKPADKEVDKEAADTIKEEKRKANLEKNTALQKVLIPCLLNR